MKRTIHRAGAVAHRHDTVTIFSRIVTARSSALTRTYVRAVAHPHDVG